MMGTLVNPSKFTELIKMPFMGSSCKWLVCAEVFLLTCGVHQCLVVIDIGAVDLFV